MRPLLCLLSLMIAGPAAATGQGSYDFAPAVSLMQEVVAGVPLTGATLVVSRDGVVVHESRYGNHLPTTRLPIASASKWVSAVAIASLVDSGLLGWDTPVGALMPDAPVDKHAITLRQLFSHTSGIGGGEGACLNDPDTTLAACAMQILGSPLAWAPGTCFAYGGSSMQVAGRMAEIASGLSWDQLFIARVVTPLGLVATDYGFNSIAPGYLAVSNPRVAGGVRTTARELLRFAQLFAQEGAWNATQVLRPETVALMMADQTGGAPYATSPDPDSYGYGIGLWRNRVDAAPAALEVASPGAFGTWPWFDRASRAAGVFFVRNALGNVEPTVRTLTRQVRTIVGDGQPLHADGWEGKPMAAGCSARPAPANGF
ncbi:MAG: serine hydrolase domain-containing protein [Pseudomonadota bacterium]|jgi:CubicO group peptidase (beta-lactamase class C family)